ncbi:unnamed protein product [Cyberlindnera jadinii]|uniref:Metallothionein n=1 Tax=Cyberlindnera jadinii (strain ATCC 18201 / CBS 1600 / BCRC 20928 / JCM 3617 / NBRC 0987 / NRRL Y-1542) TaxID=983966 RepID=A0A0H5C160_CYBJN|nr:hypothetical protein CYBJADRAFT_166602 [Cyberlindnera jadinii NRRL Y-1542]ODV74821.1 hypothetical protein CYBJADRAFT_166602 [Cyberlindnera jadinii NRRL Y-1542]CEP21513.1 unnamed protein product [Cyberlindnera jadinii]
MSCCSKKQAQETKPAAPAQISVVKTAASKGCDVCGSATCKCLPENCKCTVDSCNCDIKL